MIISLALVLLATAGGTLVSYLYDEDANFAARLCGGVCIGITALGLVTFVFASFLGLTPLSILLSALFITVLPLLVLKDANRRRTVKQDLRATSRAVRQGLHDPSRLPIGYIVFYTLVALILWLVFRRAMIVTPEGIFTGVLNNFGDLPFHISVITSFAYGNNFLPEDPTFAGARFTYPFLTDFVSAIFVRCGADLRHAMFIENFAVALAFVGLLHRWALVMLRDRLAAIITPLLVILNGGFGWIFLWRRANEHFGDFAAFVQSLPPSFTVIPDTTWRWGNAVSTLLIPQRGFLLGLPLAVIVFTQWWLATAEAETGEHGDAAKENKREKSQKKKQAVAKRRSDLRVPASPRLSVSSWQRMIAAGIIAGLLPLVHAHSFVVIMMVAGCIALGTHWRSWLAIAIGALPLIALTYYSYPQLPRLNQNIAILGLAAVGALVAWILLPRGQMISWTAFFVAVLIIALPQMWWSTHNSAVDSSKFFAWQFGWDRGKEAALAFWLKNTGLFIPLTIAAIIWRSKREYLVSRRVVIFLLPFSLCFIVPNVLKMAPWIWDNIKVLFYWWLASAPLVAILLARWWQKGGLKKALAVILFACVTTAGALDVAAIVWRSSKYQVFDSPGVQFAELIKQQTAPRSLVMHAPVHNHPVFLTGRRSLMGYPGHIWTHGLDYLQRESEIKRIYAGSPDAAELMRKYGIEYVVASPLERNIMIVNEQYFSKFEIVGDVGEYRLYKIGQR
ncbi:MAG: hypothetical protein H7Z16_14455 [Pyrinomonadaceae bacterium]|nr:hypothetical protein [Pyrinomonadaceae bacterium]